jgi:hypothetical protein
MALDSQYKAALEDYRDLNNDFDRNNTQEDDNKSPQEELIMF